MTDPTKIEFYEVEEQIPMWNLIVVTIACIALLWVLGIGAILLFDYQPIWSLALVGWTYVFLKKLRDEFKRRIGE